MNLPPLGLAHPEFALLLLVAPIATALYVRLFSARRVALRAFAGRGASLVARSAARQWLKGGLAVLALAALAVAAAGPLIDVREREIQHQGVDLVIALDVSQSMAVRDGSPDRVRAARAAIATLGKQIAGSRVALVLFSGTSILRYPATTSPEVLGEILDGTGRGFKPSTGGTSLNAALKGALDAFPPSVRESARHKAVLVVSDGEDPNEVTPDLREFRDRNVRVFTVGVGTADGGQIPVYDNDGKFVDWLRKGATPIVSRLDESSLRTIAERGDGAYWHYDGSDTSLRELANALLSMDVNEISKETVPDDRYQVFAGIALVALLLEWLISDRRRMPAPRAATLRRRRFARAGAAAGGRS